jgi:hypothetical protein
MDNVESVGSSKSYCKINDCMDLSNLWLSKRSQGLETSKNCKKNYQRFQPSQQELA